MSRFYALLVSIGLLTPMSARAQEPAGVGYGVQSGQLVRVRSAQGQLLEGRLSQFSGVAVDSVWVRGNRAMAGALIGGVALGAGSAAFWWYFCEMASEGHGCDETGQVLGLTAVGTAVGAGLGALIGSAFGTWRLAYGRSDASVTLSPVSLDRVMLNVRLRL